MKKVRPSGGPFSIDSESRQLALPILKILVPQFGQVPVMAGLPFFIVMFCGFLISTFILSLRQYPVTAIRSHSLSKEIGCFWADSAILGGGPGEFNPNSPPIAARGPKSGAVPGARVPELHHQRRQRGWSFSASSWERRSSTSSSAG